MQEAANFSPMGGGRIASQSVPQVSGWWICEHSIVFVMCSWSRLPSEQQSFEMPIKCIFLWRANITFFFINPMCFRQLWFITMDSTILELCVVFDRKLRLSNQQCSCVALEIRVYKRECLEERNCELCRINKYGF
jgi:hypothetical protein